MRPSIHFETHCSTHRSQPTFQNYSLDQCAMFFWRIVKNPCFHIAIFLRKTIVIWCPKGVQCPCPRSSLPLGAAHRRSKLRERPRRANERRPVGLLFFSACRRYSHNEKARILYIYIIIYHICYVMSCHVMSCDVCVYIHIWAGITTPPQPNGSPLPLVAYREIVYSIWAKYAMSRI